MSGLFYYLPIAAYCLLIAAMICAWFTHLFYCFANSAWGFLIAGALLPPIGMIHGVYVWFN